MIRYYLKSAIQSLRGTLRFTVLNMISLSLGLSLVVMMVILITYEVSFDSCHPNRDEILQVLEHDLKADRFTTSCPLPLPSVILSEFPEVMHATGISSMITPGAGFVWKDRTYSGFKGASVDSGFMEIFGYELLTGDPEELAAAPDRIAISESFARTVFGETDPMGQSVSVWNYPLTVSGIFRDIPKNSSVQFDVLLPEKARTFIRPDYKEAWWNGGMQVYVMLHPGSNITAFEAHLKEVPELHYPDFLIGRHTFTTRPFRGSHFDTATLNYASPPVPRTYLLILASITLVTLVVACINYINLSTAQSTKKNVDNGICQIFGARSGQIIRKNVWEAFLLILASLAVSIMICLLAMPFIELLTQRPVGQQFSDPTVWLTLFGTVVLTGAITGLLPGRSFQRTEPIQLVQAKGIIRRGSGSTRNALIVFQFTLALTLIIVQLFIFRQISYMKNADLGFDNDNLLAIEVDAVQGDGGQDYSRIKLFKEQLEMHRSQYNFSQGSVTENIPGYYYQNSFTLVPTDAAIDECLVISTAVDENFLEVFGMQMAEGRFFSPEFQTDRDAFIINESALKTIGWESIDGKFMKFHHEGLPVPVVGVLKDIHTTTLREPIRPMVYRFGDHNNFPGFLTFRVSPENRRETIAFMESQWQQMFPDLPFRYFYVKEKYFENYAEEKRFSRIIGSFTIFAILLSLLGLFGLVSFISEQRQKEIGIRKVNGARSGEILVMMNRSFLKWIGIAFLASVPIAWYAAKAWLQEFAFRTDLSPLVFIAAGFLTLLIAIGTVTFQSWRAASCNPSKSLRYE
jgi:putative ABC transport system permease protein